MDQRPCGQPPDSDVGLLQRMLGVVDWDTLFTAGTTTVHTDIAEQNQGSRSHPNSASAGNDRSQDEFKDTLPNASRTDEDQQGEDRHAAGGPNSEKMQQMRARHREAQARYRAKHRVRPVYCMACYQAPLHLRRRVNNVLTHTSSCCAQS